MATFHLKVLTVDKQFFDGEVDRIVVRTSQGDVGILPNHVPYVAALGTGGLTIIRNGERRVAAVSGGFVDVSAEQTVVLARTCDPTDRGTIIIFGDGAGAVLLGQSEEPGIISTHLHADGSYGELLTLPNADRVNPDNSIYLTMAGNEVFKVAVTELAHIVDETLEANNLERTALDWLVPHQANLRIISATAKKLGMSMDNVVVTLDRHGNTSAASVPCAFDEAVRDGRIKRGQLVLLEAFGGGFTWGSALVRF